MGRTSQTTKKRLCFAKPMRISSSVAKSRQGAFSTIQEIKLFGAGCLVRISQRKRQEMAENTAIGTGTNHATISNVRSR